MLVLDTKNLQIKYNASKKKRREMKNCPRKGSGLDPEELPPWYYTLESVLGDTNTKLEHVISNPHDMWYGQLYFDSGEETSLSRKNMYQTITRKTRLTMMKNWILVMTTMLIKVSKEQIPQ